MFDIFLCLYFSDTPVGSSSISSDRVIHYVLLYIDSSG